ncbi:MAG: RNA 2',3'-cyclic phosphodiesterase [Rhodothermales bacterium]
MPRLFVAIDIPSEHAAALTGLQDEQLAARWTPASQLHCTLRYVGEVEDEVAGRLRDGLRQIERPTLTLATAGLDVFPSRRRPRVIVARLRDHPVLTRLRVDVETIVTDQGFDPDQKPFHPHVTIARPKGATPRDVRRYLKTHTDLPLQTFDVNAFHLYRSDLRASGALHTVVETYELGR